MRLYKLQQKITAGEMPPLAGKIAEMLLAHDDDDCPLWDEFGLKYPFEDDATLEDERAFREWGELFLKVSDFLGLPQRSAYSTVRFLLLFFPDEDKE